MSDQSDETVRGPDAGATSRFRWRFHPEQGQLQEQIAHASRVSPLLAQAARINFSTRLFNLIVTNVPGPQVPLYVLGRELLDVFPVAFLPQNHALAIAIMSYNGKIDFGLLGDYDAMEDITLIGEGIEAEIKQLLEAAKSAKKAKGASPAATRDTATAS